MCPWRGGEKKHKICGQLLGGQRQRCSAEWRLAELLDTAETCQVPIRCDGNLGSNELLLSSCTGLLFFSLFWSTQLYSKACFHVLLFEPAGTPPRASGFSRQHPKQLGGWGHEKKNSHKVGNRGGVFIDSLPLSCKYCYSSIMAFVCCSAAHLGKVLCARFILILSVTACCSQCRPSIVLDDVLL